MYHFIGIKGSGMSALAQIMKKLGYEVQGSDVEKHFFTQIELDKLGVKILPFNKDNIKNTVIEKPEVEEVKVEPKKEIVVEEKKENSDVKLELINDTKKAKNIIDKVMSIKIEEFKDILVILEGEDRDLVNEITIKNEFFKAYINVRYYNIYEANEFSNPRFVSRVENTIKKLGSKMISEYKGSDNKYSDKIEKYIRLFMTVANFEQIYNSKADNKRKQELYFKTLNNYYMNSIHVSHYYIQYF